MKPKSKSKRVDIFLTTQTHKELEELCASYEENKSRFITRLINLKYAVENKDKVSN